MIDCQYWLRIGKPLSLSKGHISFAGRCKVGHSEAKNTSGALPPPSSGTPLTLLLFSVTCGKQALPGYLELLACRAHLKVGQGAATLLGLLISAVDRGELD